MSPRINLNILRRRLIENQSIYLTEEREETLCLRFNHFPNIPLIFNLCTKQKRKDEKTEESYVGMFENIPGEKNIIRREEMDGN